MRQDFGKGVFVNLLLDEDDLHEMPTEQLFQMVVHTDILSDAIHYELTYRKRFRHDRFFKDDKPHPWDEDDPPED